MISFQTMANLAQSAQMTFDNMRVYYQHYSVDWEVSKICEQIEGLENWDILYSDQVVGAIRLAFDESGCYIRDLQVSPAFQNKGMGAQALAYVETLAKQAGVQQLRLRVFKISPAVHLYQRNGFVLDSEEDNFFYLSKTLGE